MITAIKLFVAVGLSVICSLALVNIAIAISFTEGGKEDEE